MPDVCNVMKYFIVTGNDHQHLYENARYTMIDETHKIMRGVKLFIAAEYKQSLWEPLNKTESINISDDAVNVSTFNGSIFTFNDDEYIFDRTDVRAVFITLYTLVFCCCFFGKLKHCYIMLSKYY